MGECQADIRCRPAGSLMVSEAHGPEEVRSQREGQLSAQFRRLADAVERNGSLIAELAGILDSVLRAPEVESKPDFVDKTAKLVDNSFRLIKGKLNY